ncbi:unnamed protein product, partial [Tetraodon nigroviridis]
LREELLRSIWHAFTALDLDQRGKVSKSQLKVLSHNLCTVMKIPHDPVALEEHFADNNEGPLSSQGYMPYLNRFILDKVKEEFDILEFNKMCWTLCCKKNISVKHLPISEDDAFKVWCIFNFLAEDNYPLVIVVQEIEYLLRKLMEASGGEGCGWSEEKLRLSLKTSSLTVWELIDLLGTGYFSRGLSNRTLAMGINEVFQELILDVLKQGYMMKKGHKRKNWTERWFVLRPNSLSYYVSEDLLEKRGDIALDQIYSVESVADKEGRKCLFIIKCSDKSFEISASDKKKKQEWIQGVFLRSRKWRRLQGEQQWRSRGGGGRRQTCKTATNRTWRERRWCVSRWRSRWPRSPVSWMQYLQRVRELEDMYHQLEEALEDERQAKADEEAMRRLQARLLNEEAGKRAELEQLHLHQQRALSQTKAEKQELAAEQLAKERQLEAAMLQLQTLERERQEALEKY